MIYFDYTATTPVDNDVLETYIKSTNNFFANANSLHKLGQRSNHMIEVSTETICNTLGLTNHKIIYTSNATEANNIAIFGWCKKHIQSDIKPRIITTKIEHASVYNSFKQLEEDFDVIYLDINEEGLVDLEQLKSSLNKNTILVSIMWVSNILGTIQNVKEIIKIVKENSRAKLHIDCVQGICKVTPDFDFNDIDLFTISCHKIYGPKGIAGLFIKNNIDIDPILFGANNQYGLKPGTMDVALVSAFAKAIKKFYPDTESRKNYVKELFEYLISKLKQINKVVLNTPEENVSYYIINISMPGVRGETLLHKLEEKEIYVSTGSACSSKLAKPEKTVLALTNSIERATTTIRISLSHLTKLDEIDELINTLKEL